MTVVELVAMLVEAMRQDLAVGDAMVCVGDDREDRYAASLVFSEGEVSLRW